MTSKTLFSICAALSVLSLAPVVADAQTPPVNVTVLTIIDVIPDYAVANNIEASVSLLSKLADDTQHAPGVVSFKILRDAQRDNHFVITGVWKDMKSYQLYSGAQTMLAFRKAFAPKEAGPFDERIYIVLKDAS
ncbi:MAG: putative quinol monooxygenase [Caulobacteraceae bacterium]